MAKKINSEYSINNNTVNLNISLGTSNKKNPEVVYAALTSYITPTHEDFDEEYFLKFDKHIKSHLKTLFAQNSICYNDLIVVVDIATNRMMYDKPSYLDIQIYFKPKKEIILSCKNSFKTISETLYNAYVLDTVKYIERMLVEKGFELSKTKAKTIYTEI
jgi:hypothetical protein